MLDTPNSRVQAFDAWLSAANAGTAIEYHRGLLSRDRARDPLVAAEADRVWELMLEGRVELVQLRLVPFLFSYMAYKRATTTPKHDLRRYFAEHA